MKRVVWMALIAYSLGAAAEASAQFIEGPPVGDEIASVHLLAGLFSPMTTFDDEDFGETSYSSGFAIGASVTAWPAFGNRVGIRTSLVRTSTDGEADYEFAPIVVNSPTVWVLASEVIGRMPMGNGYPYASLGYGIKQYTWVNATMKSDRDGAFTGSVGYELRPASLGGLGVNLELRGYRTKYRAFGVSDGTWEFDDMGGKVGGVPNLDLMFTTGLSLHF